MGKEKKYAHLWEDKDVERWYKNLARGSQATADVRFRGLGRFCDKFGITPGEILKKSQKEISDLMMDYVAGLEEDGKAGSYIDSCLKPIKSWLKYNSKAWIGEIKVTNAKIPTTLSGRGIPTQDDLEKILQFGTAASKVCVTLVSQSGLRLEVLGDYKGRDGLKLGDFPELIIEEGSVSFSTRPAKIVVRPSLNKARREYFTFIGSQGIDLIVSYLNSRIREGEQLKPDSPLIIPRNDKIHHITTINIGDQIRNAIRSAGFVTRDEQGKTRSNWRPYDLRHYFATQMLEAETKGIGMIRDFRVYFMGHSGDIEHEYTLNNRHMSDEMVENMRLAYKNSEKYLTAGATRTAEEEYRKSVRDFKLLLLRTAGFSDDEIENKNLLNLPAEEIKKALDEKDEKFTKGARNQKLIGSEEIDGYLREGWRYVNEVKGMNKHIVEKS
ncbi:MAG: site-specific integrase [Candidatus Thermoplasmatota archaeon]|jgi:integrase|nr:site-specific integrase [Candidatus Thermoplasmatota archaeon]